MRKTAIARPTSMKIRILPTAERDLEIGADFYESQRRALAELDELEEQSGGRCLADILADLSAS